MQEEISLRTLVPGSKALSTLAALLLLHNACETSVDTTPLPTGQAISPTASPGALFQTLNPNVISAPDYTVGQAETIAVSPDGRTLLILTSGYNLNADAHGNADPA